MTSVPGRCHTPPACPPAAAARGLCALPLAPSHRLTPLRRCVPAHFARTNQVAHRARCHCCVPLIHPAAIVPLPHRPPPRLPHTAPTPVRVSVGLDHVWGASHRTIFRRPGTLLPRLSQLACRERSVRPARRAGATGAPARQIAHRVPVLAPAELAGSDRAAPLT